MRIVIIGNGNVATVLGRRFKERHQIVQVISRNIEHARVLANELGAAAADLKDPVNADAAMRGYMTLQKCLNWAINWLCILQVQYPWIF